MVAVAEADRDHTMNLPAILSRCTLVKRVEKIDCTVAEIVEQLVKVDVERRGIERVDKD